MDELRYKTVTGISGNTSVAIGLGVGQVICVSRQGEEKDFLGLVAIGTLNGSNCAFVPPNRISFGTSFPFVGTEIIHIMYKVSI